MGIVPPASVAALLAVISAALGEGSTVSSAYPARTRPKGSSALDPGALEAFLDINAEERFDLEAINSIDVAELLNEARQNDRLLRELVEKARALMPRVQSETEEADLVGAFLRAKTLDWYRRSMSEPNWMSVMPLRWGGIFHESRVPGGRLSRKLDVRLASLYMQSARASGMGSMIRSLANGSLRALAKTMSFSEASKRLHSPLRQQVAQAYLDDLAACARLGDRPFPLERMSEVARHAGAAEVNRTLSELFHQDGSGALTVLDARFHPDLNTLIIRVIAPKGGGDSATYDLIQPNAPRQAGSDPTEALAMAASSVSLWERTDITREEWGEFLGALEKQKGRLDPPPRENYRELESYVGLRKLILEDPGARKSFLIVHWKGRPAGLTLLGQLLAQGTFAPDVETDGDYLEAELDQIDKRPPNQPRNGVWETDTGWTVVREMAPGNVRTYRADRKSLD